MSDGGEKLPSWLRRTPAGRWQAVQADWIAARPNDLFDLIDEWTEPNQLDLEVKIDQSPQFDCQYLAPAMKMASSRHLRH